MAANTGKRVRSAIDAFTTISHKPEVFLSLNNDVSTKLKNLTKKVYDEIKTIERRHDSEALPELLLAGFDDEQVWQELELQNSAAIDNLLQGVSQLASVSTVSFKAGLHSDNGPERMLEDTSIEEEEEEEDEEEEEEMEEADEDDDDDQLPLDAGVSFPEASSGDESEEEKELKKLLDKAAAIENEEDGKDGSDDEEESSLFGDNFELDGESKGKKKGDQKKKSENENSRKRRTVVDDQFFKLADLESFLDQEDVKEERKRKKEDKGNDEDSDEESSEEEEEVDVFADIPSDDEGVSARKIRYKDFFDPPDNGGRPGKTKRPESEETDDEDDEEDEGDDQEQDESDDEIPEKEMPVKKRSLLADDSDSSDDESTKKSSFEQRQERLAKKIKTLEENNLEKKAWQLGGEIGGGARPENSLLQEDLDFEQQTRLAPEITEETTKSLEDIIKQRIKDQSWDDVERKVKPVDNPFEYKKRVVLDQEKSKKSLGDIYEEEYLKQAEKDKEEEEDPDHAKIRKSMTSLFTQLDALANFHYTPKPAAPEVKVLTNLPSVTVEEVAPVSVSNAAMMAPEEIKEKDRKDLKGDTEKTKEDKKSDRRAKKTEKRVRQKEKEKRQKLVEKINPGLGNKYAKQKALDDLEKQSKGPASAVKVIKDSKHNQKTDLTSSSKFFSRLQDRVTTRIADAKGPKKTKEQKAKSNSAKLKL